MTRPLVVYFGPDKQTNRRERPYPKVYFRTLLFSTSKRGRVIENLFVNIKKDDSETNFGIWVHESGKMLRGSGLFIGEAGFEATHQFSPHDKDSNFTFTEGTYEMNVFGQVVDKGSKKLFFHTFTITPETAKEMSETNLGVYFDWEPGSQTYVTHIDRSVLEI